VKESSDIKLEEINCPLCETKKIYEGRICKLCNGFGIVFRFVDAGVVINSINKIDWRPC